MKKSLLLATGLVFMNLISGAQNVNIPDPNFKAFLIADPAINWNADSEIQMEEAAAFNGEMDCGYLSISDLTGIEAFTSLTELRCYGNQLTTLDVSQNVALEYLHCGYNANMASLYTGSIPALAEINSTDNTSLYVLDVSQNPSITHLTLNENDLFDLDLTQNPALEHLICNFNNFSSIDLSQNTALVTLSMVNNPLTSLDVSACENLTLLQCGGSNLTQLDVSNNPLLSNLGCNNISTLTALNMQNISTTSLQYFNASSNPLLSCIQVDDVAAAEAAWTNIDEGATFNLDCNIVGVNDASIAQKIELYPNPTRNFIKIQADSNVEAITIMDMTGRILRHEAYPGKNIDVSYLIGGTYILKISTEHGSVSKRMIID